jgi:MFS family permease
VTQETGVRRRASNPPLGGAFARLWTASIASNLADGIGRLAVPLLAVSLTKDPVAIAIIGALAYVPWLLFGIPAGVLADRMDRRLAMALGNGVRFLVAAALSLTIATDHLSLWLLWAATLVFGIGETIVDNATNAVVPALVDRVNYDRANSRIQAAQISVDNFIATPISGVLYAAAIILPTVVGATGYIVAAAFALALPVAAARARDTRASAGSSAGPGAGSGATIVLPGTSTIPGEEPSSVERGGDARVTATEGIRYLWRHRYLRSMTIVTAAIGFGFSLAQATMILLFLDHFGVPAAAIGVLTTGVGLGALAGSLVAPSLTRRWGRGNLMFGATTLGGVGLLGVGLAGNLWLAIAAYGMGAFGVAAWNVPWGSVRQAIIPGHMLGRVLGLMRTVVWGAMPVAILLGGWLGRVNLRAPFVVGGLGSVAVSLAAARLLRSADARVAEA